MNACLLTVTSASVSDQLYFLIWDFPQNSQGFPLCLFRFLIMFKKTLPKGKVFELPKLGNDLESHGTRMLFISHGYSNLSTYCAMFSTVPTVVSILLDEEMHTVQ